MLQKELRKKDEFIEESQAKFLEKAQSNQEFDQEKQTMDNLLLSRQQEIQRLSVELDYVTNYIVELKEQYRIEKESVSELQTLESHHKSVVTSTQQELLQANKSIEWLNEELSRKSLELADYRRGKGDQITQLQTQLENSIQEKSSLEVRNQLLQKRAESLEQKFSAKIELLREVRLINSDGK